MSVQFLDLLAGVSFFYFDGCKIFQNCRIQVWDKGRSINVYNFVAEWYQLPPTSLKIQDPTQRICKITHNVEFCSTRQYIFTCSTIAQRSFPNTRIRVMWWNSLKGRCVSHGRANYSRFHPLQKRYNWTNSWHHDQRG